MKLTKQKKLKISKVLTSDARKMWQILKGEEFVIPNPWMHFLSWMAPWRNVHIRCWESRR
jgi:hypothetical protein